MAESEPTKPVAADQGVSSPGATTPATDAAPSAAQAAQWSSSPIPPPPNPPASAPYPMTPPNSAVQWQPPTPPAPSSYNFPAASLLWASGPSYLDKPDNPGASPTVGSASPSATAPAAPSYPYPPAANTFNQPTNVPLATWAATPYAAPPTGAAYPAASAGYPTSQYPTSNPPYPAPGVPYQAPNYPYSAPGAPYSTGYGGYTQWPPPTPTPAPAPAPVSKPKRTVGTTIVALLLAFALGIGSFAVGGQIVSMIRSSSEPTPTQPAPRTYPNPNDDYRNADTSVTADQSKGIVLISGISGNSQSAGTGMVLTAEGKVLTNYHVVAGTESLTATIVDNDKTYSATVVGFDAQRDVALLQLAEAGGLQTVTLDYDALKEGDSVSVVGNAEGGGRLIRADGRVIGLDQSLTVTSDSPWGAEENLEGMIATTANAVPGDSGGPMFDSQAQVTGMTTAGSQKESISFAIPISDAISIVRTIEAGRDEGTVRVGPAGYIGITVVPATGSGRGRQIQEVVRNGPADQAGIVAGSTLIAIDGTQISGDTNLANVIRALEPDTTVTVNWIDPTGKRHSESVTLGSSPVN